jgi:hypothetical protein
MRRGGDVANDERNERGVFARGVKETPDARTTMESFEKELRFV